MPRTAIHHYLRENLLPPPAKTARNAALYGLEHVERLRLIRALRGPELGPLSLTQVREVVQMVDRGVEADVAAALCAIPGGGAADGEGGEPRGERSLSDVAREAGLSLAAARALHTAGLLPGRPGSGGSRVFDEADVSAARLVADLLDSDRVRPSDLDPIGELVGELVRYEKALAGLATANTDPAAALERRHAIFRGLQALHTYLFRRLVAAPGSE